jgi:hypothetical protein
LNRLWQLELAIRHGQENGKPIQRLVSFFQTSVLTHIDKLVSLR